MVRCLMGAVGCLVIASFATAQQQISISFQDNQVIATGITSGGSAAYFGVGRDYTSVYPELFRWSKEIVADSDGKTTIELARRLPKQSLWLVADISTGAFSLATPNPVLQLERPFQGPGAKAGTGEQITSFRIPGTYMDLVLIQPGTGLFITRAGDNAIHDADGAADGFITINLNELNRPNQENLRFSGSTNNATIFVINPLNLEYSIIPASSQRSQ